jgi:hypothetical protein
VTIRVQTLDAAKGKIVGLPEEDRLEALRAILGQVQIPGGMTATDYIRDRRNRYILYGFLAVVGSVVLVLLLAGGTAINRDKVTDDTIAGVLGEIDSDLASAINVLNSGPSSIREVAANIGPQLSNAELSALTDRWVQEGCYSDCIMRRLEEMSGGGQLQSVNSWLLKTAERINEAFEELATCFRKQECVKTASQMPALCRTVARVRTDMEASNQAAMSIPGITFAEGSSDPLFGNGAMDVFFREVRVPNITYLSQFC